MSETGIGSKATCWGLALLGEGTNLISNYACAANWIAGINPDRATAYYEEGIAYAMRCIENDESQSIVMRMNLMFFYFQFAEI